MTKRHVNSGLRKVCDCQRRVWSKCPHPYHFNFKLPRGKAYRFSLDAHFGRHIDSKSEAEELAADLRKQIRAGRFGVPTVKPDQLTVKQLLAAYNTQHIKIKRSTDADSQIALIARTLLQRPDGQPQAFGEWPAADVTTDVVDVQFRAVRQASGPVAANRDLALLRACFKWAASNRRKLVTDNPFMDGSAAAVKLTQEHARSRRLQHGEEGPLLAACGDHLRAVVECALQTGMRRGEILSLQWGQVEGLRADGTWAPKAEIFLPFRKTKTKRDRKIPVSSRLKAILEMRRLDPNGEPHPATAFVFGTSVGTRVLSVSRAWQAAVLRSHGHTPAYSATANLTPASRAALKAVDLKFHDLRRECGSRWMDGGIPIGTIQRWLGHSNVSQTSTYLAGTQTSEHDHMAAYEKRLQPSAMDDAKGVHSQPQTATSGNGLPNTTAVGRERTIM
jgi:integrase